jgi:hypothetical protein
LKGSKRDTALGEAVGIGGGENNASFCRFGLTSSIDGRDKPSRDEPARAQQRACVILALSNDSMSGILVDPARERKKKPL